MPHVPWEIKTDTSRVLDLAMLNLMGYQSNLRSGEEKYSGLALDNTGNVYVVDSYYNWIIKSNSSGNFIKKWGSCGTGNKQFEDPKGIAVDNSGFVFVADSTNNRIQKFSSSGSFKTK